MNKTLKSIFVLILLITTGCARSLIIIDLPKGESIYPCAVVSTVRSEQSNLVTISTQSSSFNIKARNKYEAKEKAHAIGKKISPKGTIMIQVGLPLPSYLDNVDDVKIK